MVNVFSNSFYVCIFLVIIMVMAIDYMPVQRSSFSLS